MVTALNKHQSSDVETSARECENLPIHDPISSEVGSVLLGPWIWGNKMAEKPMGIPHPAVSRNTAPAIRLCNN